MNALLMFKIDYCLPFYGNCPLSCLRKLKTIYPAALRLAFGAPRITPINTFLIEADNTPIEIRLKVNTAWICKVFSFVKNTPLQTVLQKIKNAKRKPRILSILHKASEFFLENGINSTSAKLRKQKHPPWSFSEDKIDLTLHYTTKSSTPATVFQTKFLSLKEHYHNYKFIYTDGSKSGHGVSYSITTDTRIIKTALLPARSSIFTAEVAAIYAACEYAVSQKK